VARRSNRQSGQALLELALVVPVLVILMMAIFQFAYVIETQNGLTNALREAGRRAAATTTGNPVWTGPNSLQQWVQKQLCGDLSLPCGTDPNPSLRGLLASNVQGFDYQRLWVDPPVVSFCEYPAAGGTQYQIRIDVKYKHPLFFGPMAFATDLIDGTNNDRWDLTSFAQMRLENIDNTIPGFQPPGAPC
jgi:hypothetical protein